MPLNGKPKLNQQVKYSFQFCQKVSSQYQAHIADLCSVFNDTKELEKEACFKVSNFSRKHLAKSDLEERKDNQDDDDDKKCQLIIVIQLDVSQCYETNLKRTLFFHHK